MEHAKKMVLVEPRQIEKYKETPLDKVLSKLDGQIYDILHKDIPDDEKAKLYSASLNRYLDINKPTFLTKFESTVKESKDSEPANVGDDVESTVLEMIPKTLRSRTLQLLKHIKNNPDISWSGKGELILKNTVVPKSHAIDLLNDLVRKRVSTPAPTGWKQLADVLKEQNVPRELIGNDDRWKYINSSQEEGRAVTPTRGTHITSSQKRRSQRKKFTWEPY